MADLTNLAAVKAWLPIPNSTTTDDALISGLITSCSADFMRATRRPDLLAANYTETRDGDGSQRMILRHWPINSIASLTINGVAVSASTDHIAPGYWFDADLDPERLWELYIAVYSFTDGAPVVVGYNAGYAAIPPDVGQACIDWVVYRYKGRPNVGTMTRRTTEGSDVHVEQVDAPPTTLKVIERYTRELPSLDRRGEEREERMAKSTPRRMAKP